MAADDEKSPKGGVNVECMGGWSFLLFGIGVLGVVPLTLLLSMYTIDGFGSATVQLVVAVSYAVFMGLTVVGIVLTVVWCRRVEYCGKRKVSDDTPDDKTEV